MSERTTMDQAFITRIVEGALLASDQPVSLSQLKTVFADEPTVQAQSIQQALATLQAEYGARGMELIEVASGFRIQVCQDIYPWVSRLWTERKTKYSRATLETLALIAYRQPITRGDIEQIRGVAVSSHIIQTLEDRHWIQVIGHRDLPGRPALYGTTKRFLDYFGLTKLSDLPPLSNRHTLGEQSPFACDTTPLAEALPAAVDSPPNQHQLTDSTAACATSTWSQTNQPPTTSANMNTDVDTALQTSEVTQDTAVATLYSTES